MSEEIKGSVLLLSWYNFMDFAAINTVEHL